MKGNSGVGVIRPFDVLADERMRVVFLVNLAFITESRAVGHFVLMAAKFDFLKTKQMYKETTIS